MLRPVVFVLPRTTPKRRSVSSARRTASTISLSTLNWTLLLPIWEMRRVRLYAVWNERCRWIGLLCWLHLQLFLHCWLPWSEVQPWSSSSSVRPSRSALYSLVIISLVRPFLTMMRLPTVPSSLQWTTASSWSLSSLMSSPLLNAFLLVLRAEMNSLLSRMLLVYFFFISLISVL